MKRATEELIVAADLVVSDRFSFLIRRWIVASIRRPVVALPFVLSRLRRSSSSHLHPLMASGVAFLLDQATELS